MSTHFEEIERQAKLLPLKEKAELARILIEELEPSADADAERLWIEETQRRYDAYLRGKLESSADEDVMNRVRSRLDRNRLARECAKLDRAQEQELADEGLSSESAESREC